MQTRFKAPDIECDGCANAIKNALGRVEGVSSVDVDVERKTVSVSHIDSTSDALIEHALDRAGFPAQKI